MIKDTSDWQNDINKGVGEARAILKTLRLLIGSLKYHSDPTVASYLKAQKECVGTVFNQLDTVMMNHPRTVNGVRYSAWQPQNLEDAWNKFMKRQYILASTKTKKPQVAEGVGQRCEEEGGKDDPKDTPQKKAEKQTVRDLIADIEAEWSNPPTWTDPF